MKSESFILIQGWMINELQLKSTELLVFAIIYGYSKDNQGKFDGSLNYLCKTTNSSKNTIINCLHTLIEKEYILKETLVVNNITFCKYYQNEPVVQKLVWGGSKIGMGGGAKIGMGGGAKIEPNNTILDNTILDNTNDNKKILFSESFYNNYENLKSVLAKDDNFKKKYAGVNLKHYIEDCLLWSDSKNEKRTNRGWLATLRNFMKGDLEKKCLEMLDTFKEKQTGHVNH
jgi:hypothetical protein